MRNPRFNMGLFGLGIRNVHQKKKKKNRSCLACLAIIKMLSYTITNFETRLTDVDTKLASLVNRIDDQGNIFLITATYTYH